jgi:hypothetical protein
VTFNLAALPSSIVIGTFFMVKIRNSNSGSLELIGTLALVGTIALSTAQPATAGWFDFLKRKPTINPYNACTVSLDKATIKKEIAADACAEALHPDQVGTCVENIAAKKVDSTIALGACRSVRRPMELSTCVGDIHQQDKNATLTDVVEFCRRSLLPERYGNCVVGLNDKPLQVVTKEGLMTCIDASDRPTDIELLRTFEAADKVPTIRNPLGSPIVPPTFTPGPNPATIPSATPGSNPSAPSPGTTPQLF